jgi:hypothetical protein
MFAIKIFDDETNRRVFPRDVFDLTGDDKEDNVETPKPDAVAAGPFTIADVKDDGSKAADVAGSKDDGSKAAAEVAESKDDSITPLQRTDGVVTTIAVAAEEADREATFMSDLALATRQKVQLDWARKIEIWSVVMDSDDIVNLLFGENKPNFLLGAMKDSVEITIIKQLKWLGTYFDKVEISYPGGSFNIFITDGYERDMECDCAFDHIEMAPDRTHLIFRDQSGCPIKYGLMKGIVMTYIQSFNGIDPYEEPLKDLGKERGLVEAQRPGRVALHTDTTEGYRRNQKKRTIADISRVTECIQVPLDCAPLQGLIARMMAE